MKKDYENGEKRDSEETGSKVIFAGAAVGLVIAAVAIALVIGLIHKNAPGEEDETLQK